MISLTISLTLIVLAVYIYKYIRNFLQILKIPGPLVPKGIKGNLPDFVAKPREFGPNLANQYGPLYR